MRSVRIACVAVVALALGLASPGAARAEDAPSVRLKVSVALALPKAGPVDPRGRDLFNSLRETQYRSGEVLSVDRFDLEVDEVARVKLPNGRDVRLKPIAVRPKGALVHVSVQDWAETQLEVSQGGRPTLINAHPYEGGRLVISIEPDF